MKNIVNESPLDELSGRTLYTTRLVENKDIKSKVILNIGCGYGWFEVHALKHNCKKIYGIEISENDLETARKSINNKRIEFKVGSAIKLPFPSNYFDTVVSWDVLEHIPKNTERTMFKEINRVLKHNGKLYLSTPSASLRSTIFDPAWYLINHRHYSKKDIEDFVYNTELLLTHSCTKGGYWESISILNLYISKWIFRRSPFFHKFFMRKQNEEYNKKGYSTLFITGEKSK